MVNSPTMVAVKPRLIRCKWTQRMIAYLTNVLQRERALKKMIILPKNKVSSHPAKLAFRRINWIGYSIISIRKRIWTHRKGFPESPEPSALGYQWWWERASLSIRAEGFLFLLLSPHLQKEDCFLEKVLEIEHQACTLVKNDPARGWLLWLNIIHICTNAFLPLTKKGRWERVLKRPWTHSSMFVSRGVGNSLVVFSHY